MMIGADLYRIYNKTVDWSNTDVTYMAGTGIYPVFHRSSIFMMTTLHCPDVIDSVSNGLVSGNI